MSTCLMFMDCPAYLNARARVRCGLPAEVLYRYAVTSTDGPLECARIRCPNGHWFNGPVESLCWPAEPKASLRSARRSLVSQRMRSWPARALRSSHSPRLPRAAWPG
jgi:hypothetical protein